MSLYTKLNHHATCLQLRKMLHQDPGNKDSHPFSEGTEVSLSWKETLDRHAGDICLCLVIKISEGYPILVEKSHSTLEIVVGLSISLMPPCHHFPHIIPHHGVSWICKTLHWKMHIKYTLPST